MNPIVPRVGRYRQVFGTVLVAGFWLWGVLVAQGQLSGLQQPDWTSTPRYEHAPVPAPSPVSGLRLGRTPPYSYHFGSFGSAFNLDDALGCFQLGWTFWKGGELALVGGFDWRFFNKRVLVPLGNDTWLQVRERRYWPNIGLEKRYQFSELFGVFAQVRTGWLFGDYKATRRDTNDGFVVMPSVGVSLTFARWFLVRAAYQYTPVRNETVPLHRVYLCIGVAISQD
jgi:hypothetical protein